MVSPTNDFYFRYLFGSEQHKDLTLGFINAVLSDSGLGPVAEITLLNTFNLKNTAAEKESILDIKAKDAKGRIYNIEMQSIGNQVYRNRSLYYWARSYSEQLKEGSIYKDLQPVICINLLDFDLFPESRKAHQCFLLTEQRPPHEVLSEHCMLHFISLPKAKKEQLKGPALRSWVAYFNKEGVDMEGLTTLLESDEMIQKAHRAYEDFTRDTSLVSQYEARLKQNLDQSNREDTIRQKGREEGREEERREAARKMKESGLSIEQIARFTGLSHREITGLKEGE